MESKTYKEESFAINAKDDILTIRGKLEVFDYNKVLDFMIETANKFSTKRLDIDFRYATYISSKGIKLFARFMFEYKKPVNLIIDSTLDWQIMGLEPLSKISADGGITITRD